MSQNYYFSNCYYTTLTAIVLLSVLEIVLTQSANTFAGDSTPDDYSDVPSDPWETPLQELQRAAHKCSVRSPGFEQIARNAEVSWQSCIDSISPKFPVLESTDNVQDEKINASVIQEIDKQLHMAICRDKAAYKTCWSNIIKALNECEPGTGDVSGKLYFALYDDICRDGGNFTIENRRVAAAEGNLCRRDYFTAECAKNKQFRRAKDLCLRFQSNIDCDLSSIDPKCSNEVDKRLHREIFQRVEAVLECSSALSGSSAIGLTQFSYFLTVIVFVLLTMFTT